MPPAVKNSEQLRRQAGSDQFSRWEKKTHLWANTGRIVKMNNLLNRDCLLTALSLFTSQLLNIPVKRLGVSPWPTPSFFSPGRDVASLLLLSTQDIFDLFCQVGVKLQLFHDDFINSQLIDSK